MMMMMFEDGNRRRKEWFTLKGKRRTKKGKKRKSVRIGDIFSPTEMRIEWEKNSLKNAL